MPRARATASPILPPFLAEGGLASDVCIGSLDNDRRSHSTASPRPGNTSVQGARSIARSAVTGALHHCLHSSPCGWPRAIWALGRALHSTLSCPLTLQRIRGHLAFDPEYEAEVVRLLRAAVPTRKNVVCVQVVDAREHRIDPAGLWCGPRDLRTAPHRHADREISTAASKERFSRADRFAPPAIMSTCQRRSGKRTRWRWVSWLGSVCQARRARRDRGSPRPRCTRRRSGIRKVARACPTGPRTRRGSLDGCSGTASSQRCGPCRRCWGGLDAPISDRERPVPRTASGCTDPRRTGSSVLQKVLRWCGYRTSLPDPGRRAPPPGRRALADRSPRRPTSRRAGPPNTTLRGSRYFCALGLSHRSALRTFCGT